MVIRIIIYFTISSLLLSCAMIKPIEGGPKDQKPPAFLWANPNVFSTHVDVHLKEAQLYFDEYINPLKNTDKEIMISPPLKRPPIFSPRKLPRKYIGVKFQDPLEENTTYIINFGESIQDHTEGNKLPFFTYIFSTGESLDSIKVNGKVRDAYNRQLEKKIIVGLYKADNTFNDSVIFSEKPYYISKADEDGNYEITHVKEGRYMLIAFNDILSNQIYDPQKEKLGFINVPIDLKKDESFDLRLSKEESPLKVLSPKHTGWGHITFPFEGSMKGLKIKPLQAAERELFIRAASGDTIEYWYKPTDTDKAGQEMKKLTFEIIQDDPLSAQEDKPTSESSRKPDKEVGCSSQRNPSTVEMGSSLKQYHSIAAPKEQFPKKVEVILHKEKPPEFSLQRANTVTVPNKPVWFDLETPVWVTDTKKIKIEDQNSTSIPFQVIRKNLRPKSFALDFLKEFEASYKVFFDTAAIEDILGSANATMTTFSIKLGKKSDYGSLEVKLSSLPKCPFWLQLLNENNKVIEEFYGRESQHAFRYLVPGKYFLRMVVDENEDKVWNPGNFKMRSQPEPVYFYDKPIEIRPFWDIHKSWNLPQKSS